MDKKKLLIIVLVLVIVIAGYFFLKPGTKTEDKSTTGNNDQGTNTTGSGTTNTTNNTSQGNVCTNPGTYKDQTFPMELGVQSNYVKIVQAKLNEKHSSGLSEDGKFGCDTKAALLQHTGKTRIQSAVELYNTFLA